MSRVSRRELLLGSAALLAAAPSARAQPETPWAGEPVIDCHHHVRVNLDENAAHVLGAGMTAAMPNSLALGGDSAARDAVRRLCAEHPERFPAWLSSVAPTLAGDDARLTADIIGGAKGFGEIKAMVAADGPEMRRIYALAGELKVPVLIHFDNENDTGFERIEALLKAFPSTRFMAHANAFWGNIDANYDGTPYPRGKVTPGGLSDRLLSDYGNLFGDLSAYSGYNGLTRDPAFTPGFIERHQDKLIFGSDCPCHDGRGAGVRGDMCQARMILGALKANSSAPAFRKMVWFNAHRVYRLPA